MSHILEFSVELPFLRPTFDESPEMRVAVERHGFLDTRGTHLTFWAIGDDHGAFERALEADATVREIRPLSDRMGDRKLYRVELPGAKELYATVSDLGGVVLSTIGSSDGWKIKMHFPNHEAVSAFNQFCRERNYAISLERLYEANESSMNGRAGLTGQQSEFVLAAFEAGYFDIPRRSTLVDIADQFDISNQAASERLRRGLSTLIENVAGENLPSNVQEPVKQQKR